ncbi:hypothetical protein PBPMD00_30 [Pinkberry virus LS07-2018-MD00]|nr:hypothetical protein PBPMD00_30 [Pinkberry virus LS07-2018-MD00]
MGFFHKTHTHNELCPLLIDLNSNTPVRFEFKY